MAVTYHEKQTVGGPQAPAVPWAARLALALALVAAVVVAAGAILPPRAEPVDAPSTTFSAGRAMDHLEVIAAEPHPVGSAAQRRVRDYLVTQARRLDLPVEVQPAQTAGAENVIVRIAGSAGTGRDVVVAGHYDSADGAPGAGDNGMSVAAMVEAMRVLTVREQLANDVVLLFTDGEERGLTGVTAYVNGHPDVDRVAVAFVFDARPDSTGTTMRTTTPGDSWLVGELAKAPVPMHATSANNTSDRDRAGNDFYAFSQAGMVTAEILLEGKVVRYHTAGDDVAAVDAGALQDEGDTMLAVAEHFGGLDLSQARNTDSDRVFQTVPLVGLVVYPVWLAWGLAVLAALALVGVTAAAWRRRMVTGRQLAAATGLVAGMVLLATLLGWAAWQALLALNPESDETLQYPDFEHSTIAVAVICAVAGIAFVASCYGLSRRIGVLGLVLGAVTWWLLLALVITFGEPLFSPLVLWPLVGGVAAAAVVVWVRGPWPRAALLALAALPALVVWVPLLILEAVNVEAGPVVAVAILLLLLGSLMPQLLFITGERAHG